MLFSLYFFRRDIIKIAIAQFELIHRDKSKNLEKIIYYVKKASEGGADIILFPELTYNGYILSKEEFLETSETRNDFFIDSIKDLAKEYNIYILAGYVEREKDDLYNSAILVDTFGEILLNYRKNYLWKKENVIFTSGVDAPVIETEFGRIGILICYDMEFPEPARKLAREDVDIIFVPSCFSKFAENRWDILLNANALFNLIYVVGANVVDEYCCGKSKIIGPDGKNIIELSDKFEDFAICEIDLTEKDSIREKIPYFKDLK